MFALKLPLTLIVLMQVLIISAFFKDRIYGSELNTGFAWRITDPNATKETKALYTVLLENSGKGILFGQQDATMYGINWSGEADRSDVKSVTGSHPAVYGWDLENIVKSMLADKNAEAVARLRSLIRGAYDRGGINTLSWHAPNFVTGKNFYDTTSCVPSILPNGAKHNEYKRSLSMVSEFLKSLKGSDGKIIPVIFRPFHEHTGNWFWWGRPHCSVAEYVSLWRFTVSFLRDSANVHNALYAYSPDRTGADMSLYMERYPGDNYVDILGSDNYWELKDMTDTVSTGLAVRGLKQICTYARSKNKIAALTETGLEKVTDSTWFTSLLNRIKGEPGAEYISYIMVWRNANTGHFYAPYPGHASVPDFLKFYNDPLMLFGKDMKKFYGTKEKNIKTHR